MNKHLHRIVFNAVRGMRMVVQERAHSVGKANGATSAHVGTALTSLLIDLSNTMHMRLVTGGGG